MCGDCWDDYEKAQIDTPAVRAAAAAAKRVYEFNAVGGNLHIVLDDWNIEDDDLEFCRQQIERGGHPEDPNHSPWYTKHKLENPDSPEQLAAERECCELFMALTERERASAIALMDGYWRSAEASV